MEGLASEPLIPIAFEPVASPSVASGFRARGAALEHERLLSFAQPPRLWSWWANATGQRMPETVTMHFEIQHAMYEAAAHGQGIGLAIAATVDPFLASGRLVRLGLPAARYPGDYHLVSVPRRSQRPAVTKVKSWLVAEADVLQAA